MFPLAGLVEKCAFARWCIILLSCLDSMTSWHFFVAKTYLDPSKLIAMSVGKALPVHLGKVLINENLIYFLNLQLYLQFCSINASYPMDNC